MSVELFETIKRQTEGLTRQEKSRLGTYLLEQASSGAPKLTPGEPRVAEHVRRQHMEWLKANGEEFGGQYVALEGDRLVCTGATFREAMQAASARGRPDAFVTYLPKPDELIESGGWR
jgi:hypothetical protein